MAFNSMHRSLPNRLLALTLALLCGIGRLSANEALASEPVTASETPEQHHARMQWWREARFGMFIHWGIYSVPAGTWRGEKVPGIGEWIMNRGKIPVADYAKFAEQFNPVDFDADAWVRTARDAGMKYIVITSKHHDGFAMFHSAASAYNIYDATPFKRDPLQELASACQKYGIKLGFYYSQAQDWHHRGGAASGGHWDPAAQDGDMDAYLRDIAVPQVKEILTRYGPIAILWWDTPTDMTRARADLLAPLLKLQPGIITNNRLGGGYPGDTETPENKVPATGYPRDWEACMTMNDTWGFKSYDENWKSGEQLIRTLVDIASKGGNYLLNVGPTSLGRIPAPSLERLQQVGVWMKQNGESIYATTASPFRRLDWGRATQKPGKLYLHVFAWPADGALVVPMRGHAAKAYLLQAPDMPLAVKSTAAGLQVSVPATAPDAVSSVVVLEGVGAVDPLPPPPIGPKKDGSVALDCDEADLTGGLRVEGNTHLNFAGWNDRALATWTVNFPQSGKHEVRAEWSVTAAQAESGYVVTLGDRTLAASAAPTKGYQVISLGVVELDRPGVEQVTIKATKPGAGGFPALRSLILKPLP
jgi:alpha-L-fucosidase